jgi:ABC-type multidrug transport system ATPase subunit
MNDVKRLIFKVEGLKKSYGSIDALNIKKLDIHPGTIYAVVGSPGSGKTTLLDLLSGSKKPSSGSLIFENNPYQTNWLGKIIKHEEIFYNYGYEDFGSKLPVGTIINKLYGKKSNILMKRHFGRPRFKHLWNRSIASLTKGELHWVGMVLALESDPRVLLIDEYGTHLTNEMEQDFRSQLRRMNRTLGTTIIVSSPNESLVKNFASVIIFLDNGHISKIRSRSSRSNRSGKTDHRRRRKNRSNRRTRNHKPKQQDRG